MSKRNDGIVIAIVILVLVIGTATGSAYAMLAVAAAGLMLSLVLYRGKVSGRASLVAITAALAPAGVGCARSAR
jgi:hypothetical protein